MQPFELSAEHLAAVERRRRIVVRYDITGDPKEFVGEPPPPEQLAKWWDAQLSLQDMPGTQIDSIIWWSEGGVEASFKSDVRPVGEWIKGWVEAGVEIPVAGPGAVAAPRHRVLLSTRHERLRRRLGRHQGRARDDSGKGGASRVAAVALWPRRERLS